MDASPIVADVQKQNSSNPQDWAVRHIDATAAPRAVCEYLDTLDDEAFGAATTAKPKFTANADSASQWTAARKGPAFFAYSGNYLIYTDHGIIVDVDASRSNKTAEVGAMRKMLDRTEERFGLKPDWVAADTAYGSTDNLVWLALKRKILPFIPVFDKGERKDGTFSRSDFTWDDENDRYICPEGKEMRHTWRTYSYPARNAPSWRTRKYRALKSDFTGCALKAKCCPNSEARAIHREKYEIGRDLARQCTASEFNPTTQKRRKKVEMLFTHPKRILGLGRLQIPGGGTEPADGPGPRGSRSSTTRPRGASRSTPATAIEARSSKPPGGSDPGTLPEGRGSPILSGSPILICLARTATAWARTRAVRPWPGRERSARHNVPRPLRNGPMAPSKRQR